MCFNARTGETVVNYHELNALVANYSAKGLTVLGYPCPQFFNQEPGNNDEILNGLKYVRPGSGYVPAFQLFQKITVNGLGTEPIYGWMKSLCPAVSPMIGDTAYISWSPVTTSDVEWNFEKFLFTRAGAPYKRYSTVTDPVYLIPDIEALLA